MSSKKSVSLREYARQNSCDEKIIRRAIISSKIPPSALLKDPSNGRPMIIVEIADEVWGNFYREKRSGKVNVTSSRHAKESKSKQSSKGAKSRDISQAPKDQIDVPNGLSNIEGLNTNLKENNNNITFSEADRICKILEAQMRQIKLQEMKGTLVRREIIEKTFIEAGKIVRENILSIPDRIIDQLRSCKNRNEAHILFQDSLTQALEVLSKVPEARV